MKIPRWQGNLWIDTIGGEMLPLLLSVVTGRGAGNVR